MVINDNENTSDEDKEEQITAAFAKAGIEVVFTD